MATKKPDFLSAISDESDAVDSPVLVDQTQGQVTLKYTGGGHVEGYLTIEEASLIMGVTTRTMATYLRSGKVKATKFGKRWRITPENLKIAMNGDGADAIVYTPKPRKTRSDKKAGTDQEG